MKKLLGFLASVLVALPTFGQVPAFQDFNTNQFGVSGNKVVVKSGVLLTNPVVQGPITGDGSAITNLNGTSIASGTVAPARLGTNVTIAAGSNATVQAVFTGGVMAYTVNSTAVGGGTTNTFISTNTVEVFNIKRYGAVGNNAAADSWGISNAVMAWTNSGGVLYVPPGTYIDTNRYVLHSVGGPTLAGRSQLTIWGPGILYHTPTTPGSYFRFNGVTPCLEDITFQGPGKVYDVTGFMIVSNSGPALFSNARFNNWGKGAYVEGVAGSQIIGGTFRDNLVGLVMPTYCDGWEINTRLDYNNVGIHLSRTNIAYPDISAGTPAYRSRAPLANKFFICGDGNGVTVRMDEGSRFNHFGGYLEGATNSFFDLGTDTGGIPTTYLTDGIKFENMIVLNNRGAGIPNIRVYGCVANLTLRNFQDASTNFLIQFMTNTEACSQITADFVSTGALATPTNAMVMFSDGSTIPSNTRYWRLAEWLPRYYEWIGGTIVEVPQTTVTNLLIRGTADVDGYLLVNSLLTNGIVNIADYPSGTRPWMLTMDDGGTNLTAKTARVGILNYTNTGPLGTMMVGNWADATHFNLYLGGSYGLGAAPSKIEFRTTTTPQTADAGTLAMTVSTDGGVIVGTNSGTTGQGALWVDTDVKSRYGNMLAALTINATNGFAVGAFSGITTNVDVLRPGPVTNTLIFTKGILTDIQ